MLGFLVLVLVIVSIPYPQPLSLLRPQNAFSKARSTATCRRPCGVLEAPSRDLNHLKSPKPPNPKPLNPEAQATDPKAEATSAKPECKAYGAPITHPKSNAKARNLRRVVRTVRSLPEAIPWQVGRGPFHSWLGISGSGLKV